MPLLPVNAVDETTARSIAEDAAANVAPQGYTLTVGDLVEVEETARPFNKVALDQTTVSASTMKTYVFDATAFLSSSSFLLV